jgi:hypothetical protein
LDEKSIPASKLRYYGPWATQYHTFWFLFVSF